MSKKDDGGPAFPVPEHVDADGVRRWGRPSSMSLRDWFAGQALMGAVATVRGPGFREWSYYADAAYAIADAMLAARSETEK